MFITMLAMLACTPGDIATTPATVADTAVPGTATVMFESYLLGAPAESLPITVTGSKTYTVESGAEDDIVAPGTYTASFGDANLSATFGFPAYLDLNGEYWAAPPFDLGSVKKGDVVTNRFDTFEVFTPGTYSCEYDKFSASEWPDGEPMRDETTLIDPQEIAVSQDGLVTVTGDQPDLGVMGGYDYFRVVDDQLEMVDTDDGLSAVILSDIGPDYFTASVSNSGLNVVFNLRCYR